MSNDGKRSSAWSKLSGLLGSSLGSKSGPSVLPIGIDFGAGAIKLLQVTPGPSMSLVAAACRETPPELLTDHRARLEFQLAQLPSLIREGGFKGRRAVCAIPSWRVFCKHLQVVRQDGVPMSTLIDLAIPTQLNCEASSIVHRHVEVGMSQGKTEVIVMASPRDLVERFLRGLAAARLEPVGIHSEFTATLRAFDGVHRRDGDLDKTTLYLDIGSGTTNVMIAHGTAMAFARVIDVGGRHLDEAVATHLNCGPVEAKAKRLATGVTAGPAPRVAKAEVGATTTADGMAVLVQAAPERRGPEAEALPGMSPEVLSQPASPVFPEGVPGGEALEILTDEVTMCLRYHTSQHPQRRVDRVVFVGGEARQRGLCQHLARALKIPSFMADPLARLSRRGNEPTVGVDVNMPQPAWAVALGLCVSPTDL